MKERFQHKKSLGQHFLNSAVVPGWLCDAANLMAGDLVLEIGPGTGALTSEILDRGAKVVALEADLRAISELETKFTQAIKNGNLVIKHTDVRKLDLNELGFTDKKFKIVANIPYYLSGLLFRECLSGPIQPSDLVFLVQKEVAKRATTKLTRGEKESLLSLSVKAYGEPNYIKTVGRGHFVPPPAVDSAIIAIHDINRDNFRTLKEADFFHLLHLGFGQKRKQLLGNLAKEYDREKLAHIFSTLNIPLSTRGEDLSLENWLKLATEIVNVE